MRRFRWWGEPGEEPPDVGDVLVRRDSDPEWYLLVHASRQVRGRGPEHQWLVVTRHDLVDGYGIPEVIWSAYEGGGRFIHWVPRRGTGKR